MPKMDGIAMTEKIKEDIRTSHIPVILLTAKVDTDSRMKGLKTGANDYLPKPFLPEELRIRVNNLMAQRERLAAKFLQGVSESKKHTKELSMDERFIKKAQEVITSSMANPNFGVELLAEEMNLSRTQLFRKFKALVNTSPSEFINDIRLHKAADLIRAKTDALAQISYSVGYNEQSYFAKRFRKKFGMSPSEYSDAY
jgi:AraC-like DNA-binding protein